jgi:hypothetical protein
MQHLNDQVSFGRAPQGPLFSFRRGLALDPFAHFKRVRIALETQPFAARTVFLGRKIQLRIVQINMSIRMNVGYKDFALIFQGSQQCEGLSVPAIHAHLFEANPTAPRAPKTPTWQLSCLPRRPFH